MKEANLSPTKGAKCNNKNCANWKFTEPNKCNYFSYTNYCNMFKS